MTKCNTELTLPRCSGCRLDYKRSTAPFFKSFQWLIVKQVLLLLLRANVLSLKVNSDHKEKFTVTLLFA